MTSRRCVAVCLAVAVALLMIRTLATAETATPPSKPDAAPSAAERDGRHDFDFVFGAWKCHLRRLLHPLSGSKEWVELDGTDRAFPLLGGHANIDTIVVDDPSTHSHIEGLTLRLYDPKTHEWSLYWASTTTGTLALPPTAGRFDGHGRGEFYDNEEFQGRPIVVRFVWSNITPTSFHFEQSFSPDAGKTWEVNWIYDDTRMKE